MWSISIFSCLLLVTAHVLASEDIKLDEGVLVLNKDNFKKAIKDNEFILVEFYAPWCGHCKSLAPEYAKAAQQLAEKNSNIKLGKVDATEENDLAEEHDIRGYPTLKFFRNGVPIDYTGERQAADIIAWVTKKSGPPTTELETVEAAEEFIKSDKPVVVGCFKDRESDAAKNFTSTANAMDDYAFGITSNEEFMAKYDAKCDGIVLFKPFDEKKNIYDGETVLENVKKFVEIYSLPLINEFNHDSAMRLFGGVIKSQLIFFVSKEAGHIEKYVEPLRDLAKQFREDVLFVTINSDEEDHQRILEYFGMAKKDIPTYRLIKVDGNMPKYKPESKKITQETIKEFVQNYLEGKLKEHLLSQELPEDWDKNPVKVLVATNFDEVTLDKKKDVLVEFYAPWCGHCKQLAPIYEQLGEKYKDSETVVIAKMDATANELEHTKIKSFPTIKLYRKGDNQVINYNLERTYDDFVRFMEAGGNVEDQGDQVSEDEDAGATEATEEQEPEHKKDEL